VIVVGDGAPRAAATLLRARDVFLRAMACVQRDADADGPTLLLTRAGDAENARRAVADLEAAFERGSSRDGDRRSAASTARLGSILRSAVARCERAPFAVTMLRRQSALIERELVAVSAQLATPRSVLGEDNVVACLTAAQARHFAARTVNAELLRALAAARRADEDAAEEQEFLVAEGGAATLFDADAARHVERAAAGSELAPLSAGITVLPLAAITNSSTHAVGDGADANSAAAVAASRAAALLDRLDFGARPGLITAETAAIAVAALRRKCLLALHRRRDGLARALERTQATLRDFVESTAVAALRAAGGGGAGRCVVVDSADVARHATVLARVPFRLALLDDVDDVLGAPGVPPAVAAGPVLRPMLHAWALSLAAAPGTEAACGTAPWHSVACIAVTWDAPRVAADLAALAREPPLDVAAVARLATNSISAGGAGGVRLSRVAATDPIVPPAVSDCQRLLVASPHVAARHRAAVARAMRTNRAAPVANAPRRQGQRQHVAVLAAAHVAMADEAISAAATDPHLFVLRGVPASLPSDEASPCASLLSRSIARSVSLWAVPLVTATAAAALSIDTAGVAAATAEDDAELAQPSVRGIARRTAFFAAVDSAVRNLAALAPADAAADAFHVAFVSERGALLFAPAAMGGGGGGGAAGGDPLAARCGTRVETLEQTPSSIDVLVLVVVPAAVLAPVPGVNVAVATTASDPSSASRLLLRTRGAAVVISSADFFATALASAAAAAAVERERAEAANAPATNLLLRPGGASGDRQNAVAVASAPREWVRRLMHAAALCARGLGAGPWRVDADALFGAGGDRAFGPALEIRCPRHQQQARGFLLFGASRDGGVRVSRLVPPAGDNHRPDAGAGASGGLYGACRLACLARFAGCTSRAHMCLSSCHVIGPPPAPARERRDADHRPCDSAPPTPARLRYSNVHNDTPCPFSCARKLLACGHACARACGAETCACSSEQRAASDDDASPREAAAADNASHAIVVVVERSCGETCVVGVDSEKNPTTAFFRHRAAVVCAGLAPGATDEQSLPPCTEEVQVACARCLASFKCLCCDAGTSPLCASCAGATPVADGAALDKARLLHRMLVKRTGLLAARDGAESAERVAHVLARHAAVQAASDASLAAALERGRARSAADVALARSAMAAQEQLLTDMAASRAHMLTEIRGAARD
jgi:hypothetical protein